MTFASGRKLRILLWVVMVLIAWKFVRTDWVVIAPSWYLEPYSARTHHPPLSPAWDPPKPNDVNPSAKNWGEGDYGEFFFGSFLPAEQPYLEVEWWVVITKFVAGLIVAYPIALLLSEMYRRLRCRLAKRKPPQYPFKVYDEIDG